LDHLINILRPGAEDPGPGLKPVGRGEEDERII
jgi:hypothetical protein